MGKGFLIDSNAVIDFFNYSLPDKGIELLLAIEPVISIITRIEILSKKGLLESEVFKLQEFLKVAVVYNVDESIAAKTVEARLSHKIKLPDAIIAATALRYNLTLITRNVSDFKEIKGLKIIDPYTV